MRLGGIHKQVLVTLNVIMSLSSRPPPSPPLNVTLGTSNKSSCLVIFTLKEMLIYKHCYSTFPTSQEGTRALGTASNNNVNH